MCFQFFFLMYIRRLCIFKVYNDIGYAIIAYRSHLKIFCVLICTFFQCLFILLSKVNEIELTDSADFYFRLLRQDVNVFVAALILMMISVHRQLVKHRALRRRFFLLLLLFLNGFLFVYFIEICILFYDVDFNFSRYCSPNEDRNFVKQKKKKKEVLLLFQVLFLKKSATTQLIYIYNLIVVFDGYANNICTRIESHAMVVNLLKLIGEQSENI